jgi:membrane-associated phospholipid phosphatase
MGLLPAMQLTLLEWPCSSGYSSKVGIAILALFAFMSYTRIYLGVHYPGDILVGAIIGLVCGWIGYRFANWLLSRFSNRKVDSYSVDNR